MKHATRIFHFASLLMCFLFAASFSSYADGSKDIYPDGVKGGRARLRASTASSASYPFPTLGTHYVYAKAGEVIAIASSTQGVSSSNANNASRLILTGPDGNMIVSHQTPRTGAGSEVGRIPDRNAEKRGPHLPNQADGGYTPYYYDVPAGAEGIYKVEFIANGGETSTTTQRQSEVYAYADWTQNNSSATIAAWDISVSNAAKNAWQKGRVYANILNMDIDAGFKDNYNFYGQLKILTKDGYTYNVRNNGNNGISFTFFVNNKGFIDKDGQPIYQSLNTTTGIADKIQNPTKEDTESGITHKIFYTLPDPDLPTTANGAVPGGTTWLKNPRLTPTVENLNVVGVDGTVGQMSNKGGQIRFDANLAGRFKIEIISKAAVGSPGYFPTREISGSALAGTNNIPWDGKDGAGVALPNGLVPAILNIQLQGAEVHFPYFDMEINPNGMILELLNAQLSGVQSDIVYWDDSLILPARDIPSNPVNASQFITPLGTSSSLNGHKWGSSSSPTSGTFADERSIDTWTFILGAKEIKEITVDVKEADLEVVSIVPSKTIVTKGEELSYTVKVKNGGPSDVIGKKDPITGIYDNTGAPFTFKLPAGFTVSEMQFVSACGATEAVPVAFDPTTGLYKSVLKLASGCEGQYVFKGTVGTAMVAGSMEVWATIMRPNDVTDIDATNPNPNVPPTDPYFECSAYDPLSGQAIPCNNIKKNNTATVINKITATKEINGNPAKVKAGDVLTYNIILENTNSTDKTGVTASDVLPAGLIGATAISHGGTLTGTTVTWDNLTVPANNKITLSFKTTVGPNSTGITSIRNVASVVDPIDPTTPLTPEVLVPVELVSSFTAIKKVTGGLVDNKITAGSEITYSIEVLNTGNTALANLEISDVIPDQMTYVTGTADNGGVLTGSTLNWVINIPVGQPKTVSFKVKVADNLTGVAAIKNIATITDPANPTTPLSPEVEVPTDPIRSFTATKVVSAGLNNNKIVAGSTITYSIGVKNTGSTELTGIKISDVIPANTTYKIGTADNGGVITGNTLNWTIDVPFGQTKTLNFQVEVTKDLTGIATVKNVATVTDPLRPTNPPVNPEVEVPTDPVKSFTATKKITGGLQNNKIVAGSTITYSIEVKNTGSTALTNIAIADNIPGHTTYVNGTADNGGVLTGSTLNWAVNLAFGESKTVSFQVKVANDLTGIATIKNTATVTDPTTPSHPPVIPEVEVPTDPIRSFTATKVVSAGLNNNKIVAGSTITYSIEVKNTGSTALTNIAIADNIPDHTTYVEGTVDHGGGLTGNTLNWVVNLAFGESKTVSFQVKVADNLTGIAAIKNVATITDPVNPTTPVSPEVEVPTDPIRSFTATKVVSAGLNNNKIVAGSTITYSIGVKNTGSTELTGINISDVIPANTTYKIGSADNGGAITGNTLNWTIDVPFGQTKTLNFQVEVAKDLTGIATVKNVATVTDPLRPTNPPVNPEVEVPTDPVKSFTATKKITGGLQNNKIVAGSTITYSIEVKNTGSTALTNIAIADNIPGHTTYVNGTANLGGSLTGSTLNWVVNLAFGESKTVSFQVKVADNLTGVATIKNTATITDPTTPSHPPVIPEVEVPTDPIRSFTATKVVSAGLNNNKIAAGSTITYSIVVKNTGSTELTGIKISDVIPANTTYKIGSADNGGAITGNTLNWTIDVPFGQTKTLNFQVEVAKDLTGIATVKNVATVTDPLRPTNPPVNPEVEVPTDPVKSFTATKKITGGLQNNKIVAGSTITYSIEVTNTGSTALTNIAIADKIPGHTTYINGTADNGGVLTGSTLNWAVNLAFGESKTVSFQVKVANDLTGIATIKNTATITDPTTPTHPPVIPEVEVPTDPIRSFTATKVVSAGLNNNKIAAGSTITYSIGVKNTGSTELTGIKISDVIPANTTYKIGTADNGGVIMGNTLNWTIDVPFGQTKTLNFQVEVAKDLTGIATVKNVATVTDPLRPTNPPVNPEVEVPTDPVKSFTATKKVTGGLQNNKIVAGSTITYSIEVTNTGSTALTNIAIADNIPGHTTYVNRTADNGGVLTGSTLNWAVNLAFGESKTVSFQVKVANDLTGIATIKNAATVTDPTTPSHPPVIPEVEVPTDPVKSFTAIKKITGGLQNNKIVAGSTITYSIEVTNTGSTALTNIAIADNIPGHTTYVNGTADNGGVLTGSTLNWAVNLAFGESKTVSFQVKVANDLTGIATIKNAATVTDPTTPSHPPVTPEVEVPTDPVKSFTATKKVTGGLQNNKIVAGSTITYSIEVTNTGSTALTNIAIADKLPDHTTYVNGTADNGGVLTGSILNWSVNLAFGESKTVSFQVKVADNLTGVATIKNAATITDPTTPGKPPVIPEVEVPTEAKRSFTTIKRVVSGLVNGKVPSEAELVYAIDVVNTGGEDLIGLNIADDLPAGTSFVRADQNGSQTGNRVNWTINVPFGQTKTVLLTLKVAADLTNVETIVNKAIVTDPKDPANPKVPEVTVPTEQKAAITLSKTAIAGDHQKVGELISYHLVLKNTGNVTVKNIIITDDNADAGSISPASIVSLAPNETVNIRAKHTLTQKDLDKGYVSNLAKADGKDPKNKEVHAESKDPSPVPGAPTDPACKDCTITPTTQKGALSLSKTAVAGTHNKAGGIINYNLVLKNTGNVTLRNIIITDDNADAGSISPANIASLAPGATVNITAKHTLTQADMDRGSVSNLAKADGKDPKNNNVHAESKDPSAVPGGPTDPVCKDCTLTPTEQLSGINLVKKITNKGTGEQDAFILNDKIEYTFIIKNTGNTTLKGIVLNDPLLGTSAIQIPGSLAPGESMSHKEYYTITAADIAVGKVTNQARVTAKDPKDKEVTALSGTDAGNNNPTVISLAKPPVAKDDLAKAEQNKPVKIEVQKNDEPGNSPIVPGSTKIITQPKNGTLTLNPDGTVTYTPNPGFTGTDEFVYTVTDKNGQISNPATVKVEVTPSKPLAIDDVAETEFNKEVEIPLLNNDKTDGAAFEKPTVEIIEQPKHGVLRKNPDGTVVYVPNSGFTGKDSFTYKVKDANGNWTNIAKAEITIKGFFIPNVITPNGDGKNDEFVIVGLEEFNSAELTIFNRWGNEVYRNGNYRNTWTGEGLNEGTYYYLIRLKKDGKLEVHKGWVLIKR
ncbi:Ig-like domain-containing protein [Pedobacter sp. FW305-3-2-15-E-R2A2]|uniref:DUF7507 domain-containing protein n=1 Tax=Pedobacter sp. FW305-3-2-15-E-R2A2 TaxID=3140251 RepID=UPI0031406135